MADGIVVFFAYTRGASARWSYHRYKHAALPASRFLDQTSVQLATAGRVAVYDAELSADRIKAHTDAMVDDAGVPAVRL